MRREKREGGGVGLGLLNVVMDYVVVQANKSVAFFTID